MVQTFVTKASSLELSWSFVYLSSAERIGLKGGVKRLGLIFQGTLGSRGLPPPPPKMLNDSATSVGGGGGKGSNPAWTACSISARLSCGCMSVSVRVRVRAGVRACVRACVHACVRACVRVCVCVFFTVLSGQAKGVCCTTGWKPLCWPCRMRCQPALCVPVCVCDGLRA